MPAALDVPPLTVGTAFSVWHFDPLVTVGLVVAAAAYGTGVRRLRRRGDAWPLSRSFFFGLGLLTVVLATMSSLGAYDDVLFWTHMVQHMVLTMLTPVCLALGAPITLALRALPRRPRGGLVTVLHSRPARVLTHPLLTAPLFVGTLYVLYFTPLYTVSLRHPVVHDLLHAHFVLAGSLFLWPLLGLDPVPLRLPYPARLGILFVTLPVHAWLGIALMSARHPVAQGYYASLHRTWGPSLLADQHLGGALLWSSGDLVSLALFAAVFLQWSRADEREGRRVDRHLDRLDRLAVDDVGAGAPADRPGATADEEDRRLAAYNDYLARLHAASSGGETG